MRSHDVDYEIIGHDIQMVEVGLDPNEGVIAEAGAMTYMEDGIAFETRLGDGSDPDQGMFGKLFSAGKRLVTGELSSDTFHERQRQLGKGGVQRTNPGFSDSGGPQEVGGEIICQRDSFLVAAMRTVVDLAFSRRIGAGFFGDEGFILQSLRGDGLVFIHTGGTMVRKELNNETLRLDTGCLVAFTPGIDYDIELAGGLKSMLFGGEGLVLATLSGTGSM